MSFERDLRKHFEPLLSLSESCVSLEHYSLRGFLELWSEVDKFHATFGLQPLENPLESNLRPVHAAMATLCLQYMLAAFRGHDDPLEFLKFACSQWTEHTRKAGGLQVSTWTV